MQLLKNLVESKTYEGDYTQIVEVIKDFVIKKTDGKVFEQKITDLKSNIIVCFGTPRLVINCHMDTVVPSNGWDHSPTQLIETKERFYGLGTTDTKGNIYMLLKAVEKLRPENIMLLFSIDEEAGTKTGVEYFLESEYKNGLKKAIVCEPTLLRFANKHKSVYSFWVEHEANAVHSSLKASSAVVEAAKNILQLDAHHYNIGKVECSNASNVIAEHCKFKASIRSYDSFESVYETIKNISGEAVVTPSFIGRPLQNEQPDFQAEFCEVNYWTEAPLFQNAGINAVVFGVGSIEQAHSANEFVDKKQLEDGQKIIEKIIEDENFN